MSDHPNNVPQEGNNHVIVRHEEILLQGPLPSPDILERYRAADPTFPERIMKMAEDHNKADTITKNRISLSNLIVPIIGQVFTLLISLGSLFACVYLAMAGHTGAAIATIVGGLSPIIIGALKNLGHK